MTDWPQMKLGDACKAGGGFIRTGPFGSQLHQSDYIDDPGGIPVVMPKDMSGGRIERSSIARIGQETADRLSQHLLRVGDIVLSRRGDVGRSVYISDSDLPALCGTGSMRINVGENGPIQCEYLRYYMQSRLAIDYLEGQAVGATMPNLNAGIVEGLPVSVPPVSVQVTVAAILATLDDQIENNRCRIKLLEQMARAIYIEWFAHFRYPGNERPTLVDTPLGQIPEYWKVASVAAIAAPGRHAVTGGPFGSKLGRKDYVGSGVPVVRGANLRVGGGFDDEDLVFVTRDKAEELRSSLARRGDILVTQRGTLGQVGIIPERSRFEQYLLSQSQMKISVDPSKAAARFVYAQFSTAETTARFAAQAMSSGVPHVNLALLRNFEIVIPPLPLQARFSDCVDHLAQEEWSLQEQSRRLAAMRDLLLPRLVTGQIDVSRLSLDQVLEAVA